MVDFLDEFRRKQKRHSARVAVTLGVLFSLFSSYLQILFFSLPAQAFSSSWTFDAAGDYTLSDSAKLQVTGGQAQLGRTPAWWDTSYAYRKRITVTAGSTAITTNDTITLNTDAAALVTAGKLQSDQDDLRIVYWNGSTNSNIDRDYLAGGLGAIAASPGNAPANNDIRFKAQAAVSASASDNGYYLYYGNGSATAGPTNLDNVYRYYDPFDSAGTWALTDGAGWSINSGVSGRLAKTSTSQNSDRFAADTGNGFSGASNWYFETTMRRTGGTDTTSMAATAAIPEAAGKGYRLTTFGTSANDMELWAQSGNISQGNTPVNYGTFTVTTGTDYRMTMRYQTGTCATGIRVSGWFDGTTRHDRTGMNSNNCPAVASNWNASAVMYPGVHVWTDEVAPSGQASWDDYKVWQYLNESIALGSEETTYPNDSPTITPTTPISFTTLSSFSQTATLNGGSIGYILSNDGGTTWLYHNGTNWVSSDGTVSQSTTAANINTNVSTFPVGSGSFLFRAFLTSSGTQLVQLDTVSVNGNVLPTTPTLSSPADAAAVTLVKPTLQLSTTDTESDYVRYKIQLDRVNTFSSGNLQTFDQTATQTGWSGQDAQSASAYASGTSANHTLQSALTPATTYYWRAAAVDPGGANTFSGYSSTRSFTTPALLTASSFTASTIGTTTATVTWSTTTAATTTIEYGTTASYGTSTTVSGTRTSHSVALTGLTPNTTYHYRVSGTDASGQSVTSADQTFTTLADNGLSNLQVANITTTSAVITWTTSNASSTTVDYGTTASYGSTATVAGSVTSHSVALNGLTPATVYHYRVSSTDGNGVTATSTDQTFTTLTPTLITNVLVTKLSATSVRVTWTTNHAADSKVRYGTSTDYGSEVSESTLVTSHSLTISGLTPSTTYHYEALSTGNSSASDADATFTTESGLGAPVFVFPVADQIVTVAKPKVTGIAPSGSTVTIVVDGVTAGTAKATTTSTGTGNFAFSLTKPLIPGEHSIAATASKSGATSSTATFAFTVDLPFVRPTLEAPILQDGAAPSIIIPGFAYPGSTVEILVNGTVAKTFTVGGSGTKAVSFAQQLSGLAPGTYTIQVRAKDANGKESQKTAPLTFTVSGTTGSTKILPKKTAVTYVVKPGDSLWKIATLVYGKGALWTVLAKANTASFPTLANNPGLILPGWALTVPSR